MGLFTRKKQDAPSAASTTETPRPGSYESTPQPSKAPSVLDKEKNEPMGVTVDATESRTHSRDDDMNPMEKRIDGIQRDEEELEADDGIEYPKKMKLALITIALCLSVFCMALDNTIISTAIPRITDEFHAIDDVGWYGSACTFAHDRIIWPHTGDMY